MHIQIKESFAESIEKIVHRNSWWYKTYELFRYDLPRFFKNIWNFRKALWNHYWFDHHGTLMFLETGLTHISDTIEKYGMEIDETRLKKVVSMRKAVQLIKNYNEDNYIDMAEKELGKLVLNGFEFEPAEQEGYFQLVDKDTPEEKEHNKKVFARAREIGEQEWNELFEILKGQDYSTFDTEKDWNKQFDGSGMRSWWD
jgi:hypothetical protein